MTAVKASGEKPLSTVCEVPDELWERLEPVLLRRCPDLPTRCQEDHLIRTPSSRRAVGYVKQTSDNDATRGETMEAGNDPLAVIEALAEHEEALGALYAAFAELYPVAQELWSTLSEEERGHAALLRSLPAQTDELAAFLDARRFRPDEVRSETVRLRSVVRTAPFAGMDLLGAFRLARKLEDELIESQVFTVREDDPPALAAVLASLAKATEGHRHTSLSRSPERAVEVARKQAPITAVPWISWGCSQTRSGDGQRASEVSAVEPRGVRC